MSDATEDMSAAPAAGRLPRAFGDSVLSARFRSSPEDFFVEEIASFQPSGEGEHLLLTVEKRGMNTVFVAKTLAAWAGIAEMGIGYAGMKDRHAVTRQRFSVHFPKRASPDIGLLESADLRVLEHSWHNRKLSRGALAGNRFVLVLRDVLGDHASIEARLEAIRTHGIPNYFGEQRFGREGDNVVAARRLFAGNAQGRANVAGGRMPGATARVRREQRSIYLSAARSEMFNAVLGRRIGMGNWNIGVEGEVWMLDGTQSVFGPEPFSAELKDRVLSQDIHPTGPMWGAGELRSRDQALEIERTALAPFADLQAGLEKADLRQERRSLRVRVHDLQWQWQAEDVLQLGFRLAPGSYATEVLAELGEVR
jgi:tRNA pseudouridine13 synthase